VSPQNVLISYAGEVKLVDFGIAKATMKARQTAVGVIKGKYYYMSPEQAWGDPIDYRSDIFSAGIVLYEMLTGQMLYLEEDLHRLLDMARKAEIAPPSTLRKGIPPQLERIVMHALTRVAGERYQSASDFASDLERFLHTYSPVFTAAKVANILRQIVGEPAPVPEAEYDVEVRDGPIATHSLSTEDLIHDKDEIHDENSVIFRVADLKPKQPPPPANPAGRVTRQAEIKDVAPPPRPPSGKVPVVPRAPTPPKGAPTARPSAKPRQINVNTNPVAAEPSWAHQDQEETLPGEGDELENIGERTMISGAPSAMGGGGFMIDAGEDGVDATMVSAGPPTADDGDPDTDTGDVPGDEEDEGPTLQRDFRQASPKLRTGKRGPAEPALAAKIHAPAVSELRKPRTSRRTPGAGVPAQPNVLQAIVGAQVSEPMPSPSPSRARNEDSNASTIPQQPSPFAQSAPGAPPARTPYGQFPQPQPQPPPPQQPPFANGQMAYATDASGMPMGIPTPPSGVPIASQSYPYPQQPPPGYAQPPGYPQPPYPHQPPGYPQMTPQGLYQFQNPHAPPPTPMSLTGQLRLFEADEMPAHYKVSGGPRWVKLTIAGVIAISLAAVVTYLVIRTTRETPGPTAGTVLVESVPANATVVFDGALLGKRTPVTVDGVPVGTHHEVRVELAGYRPFTTSIDMPTRGGEVPITALLKQITGKIRVITHPDGAEVTINGEPRGRAPTTINDIDMASAKTLELRLKDYQPYIMQLQWPADGQVDLDIKLQK
jgi:hypothetical protein